MNNQTHSLTLRRAQGVNWRDLTYLYIIAPKHSWGPIKVGISEFPYGRLEQLQTGSPVQLRVVQSFGFPSRRGAMIAEKTFHSAFDPCRLHGEWFNTGSAEAMKWFEIERNVLVGEGCYA